MGKPDASWDGDMPRKEYREMLHTAKERGGAERAKRERKIRRGNSPLQNYKLEYLFGRTRLAF
jgi:hypothetical protein